MYGLPENVCVAPVSPVCIFHRFVYVFCMLEIISSFKRLRAESQVFALLMLFICVILNTIIISKYLYSAKFTNKCALMRCSIKYIVIHCVQYIYIYIYIYFIYTMMVVTTIKHITVIWLALRWYMIL